MRTKPSPHYEAGDLTGRSPDTIDLNFEAFLNAFNHPAAENGPKPATTAT